MTDKTDSKEREAFEDWASRSIGRVWRDTTPGRTDCYQDASTNIGWRAWQARASIAPSSFDAADMATAWSNGFKDGVASLAASAGSEPVAPVDRSDAVNLARNMLEVHECKWITPRGVETLCNAVLAMDAFLLSHPSPPEGMTGGWMPIETAPRERGAQFIGLTTTGRAVTAEPMYCVYDGPAEFRGWFEVERGAFVPTDLKGWMPLPPPPTSSADSRKGD